MSEWEMDEDLIVEIAERTLDAMDIGRLSHVRELEARVSALEQRLSKATQSPTPPPYLIDDLGSDNQPGGPTPPDESDSYVSSDGVPQMEDQEGKSCTHPSVSRQHYLNPQAGDLACQQCGLAFTECEWERIKRLKVADKESAPAFPESPDPCASRFPTTDEIGSEDGPELRPPNRDDTGRLKSAIQLGLHKEMWAYEVTSWADDCGIDQDEALALWGMLRTLGHFEFMQERDQALRRLAGPPQSDEDLLAAIYSEDYDEDADPPQSDEDLLATIYNEDAEPAEESEMDLHFAAMDKAVAPEEEAFLETVSQADDSANRLWGHTTQAERDEIRATLKAAEPFRWQGPPAKQRSSDEGRDAMQEYADSTEEADEGWEAM